MMPKSPRETHSAPFLHGSEEQGSGCAVVTSSACQGDIIHTKLVLKFELVLFETRLNNSLLQNVTL